MAKSVNGVQDIVYALIIEDSKTGTTYGTVKELAPAIQVAVETASDSATQYANNMPYDTDTATGETTLNLEVPGLDPAVKRELLGLSVDKGVTDYKTTAKAPYVAVGYKFTRGDGTEIHTWLLKGKFRIPNSEGTTKAEGVEFKTTSLDATFITRESDGSFMREADTMEETYIDADTFFDAVPTTVVAP
ncbi:hypothetical protein AKG34_13360 [Peribacillus butanolivorans]|uniref:major tail protein n=1 Tax=Peribacillus butanolivorans TaxID=421767 RepID=UPI0006A6E0E3|nr:major tail protein [Peribacillus butanolivorans]KON69637.1 hypothetical protein AKG34_13360 [Peribacillus butanolivorans]